VIIKDCVGSETFGILRHWSTHNFKSNGWDTSGYSRGLHLIILDYILGA
jgi:hypothetical protein